MADLINRLGDRIRLLRKDQQLSQEQLGELAGLHTNYIGQVERGEKNVTVESLEKIASGLGVSMEDLFRFIDPAKRRTNSVRFSSFYPPAHPKIMLWYLKSSKIYLNGNQQSMNSWFHTGSFGGSGDETPKFEE